MTSQIPAGFPVAGTPLVDGSGAPTLVWQQFLANIYNRTGGATGQSVVNSVAGQSGDVTLAELAAAGLATTAVLAAAVASLAPLASPAFNGTPTVPTAGSSDNSTQIANTAWVRLLAATLAPLVSPAFTGHPTAPTPVLTDNGQTIPNTAWVQAVLETPGASAPVTPTVGPSPFSYKPGQRGALVIAGGAITSVAIQRDGFAGHGAGAAAGMFPLSAHDTITITYTSAPTLFWFPS